MTTVVFVGPSLFGTRIDAQDDLMVRPPAACGDLLKAVHDGAKTIGLVDGVFGSGPSVWHKEILFALSRGVRVFGAASMGALRAAECDAWGMTGIGAVYRDYRDGRRTADADVALVHAPAELSFRPLTEPLVDVEATLERGEMQGWLSKDEYRALLHAARTIHYSERSWRRVIRTALLPEELYEAIAQFRCSQKRLDALELLARVRDDAPPACTPAWSLSRTPFLAGLQGRLT